jgi:hypothetical protein
MIMIDPHASISFVDQHPWLVPLVGTILIPAAKTLIPALKKIRERV